MGIRSIRSDRYDRIFDQIIHNIKKFFKNPTNFTPRKRKKVSDFQFGHYLTKIVRPQNFPKCIKLNQKKIHFRSER